MKTWWEIQLVRIDALTLRERVFLFISILAASIAFADMVWLSPAQTAHSQLKQRFSKQSTELARLRDEMKAEALKPSPARLARAELARIQVETGEINNQIRLATEAILSRRKMRIGGGGRAGRESQTNMLTRRRCYWLSLGPAFCNTPAPAAYNRRFAHIANNQWPTTSNPN